MPTHFMGLPFLPSLACFIFCCMMTSWGGGGGGAAERSFRDTPMESRGWFGLAEARFACGAASGLGGTIN